MKKFAVILMALMMLVSALPLNALAGWNVYDGEICTHPRKYRVEDSSEVCYKWKNTDEHNVLNMIDEWCLCCGTILNKKTSFVRTEKHTNTGKGGCTYCARRSGKGSDHYNAANNARQRTAVKIGDDAVGKMATVIQKGNIRKNTSVDSTWLGTVKVNEQYEILGCQNVGGNRIWYQIQYADGMLGWISAILVSVC